MATTLGLQNRNHISLQTLGERYADASFPGWSASTTTISTIPKIHQLEEEAGEVYSSTPASKSADPAGARVTTQVWCDKAITTEVWYLINQHHYAWSVQLSTIKCGVPVVYPLSKFVK